MPPRTHTVLISLSLTLLPFLTLDAVAKTARFDLRDAGQRNLIYFVSEGLLQKTVGLSHALSGWLEIDPEKVGDGVRGEIEADVRTFDTGIDAVTAEMRKFVGSAEYPLASLTITKLVSTTKGSLLDGQPATLRVEGNLNLRGVSRPQVMLAKVTYFRDSEATRQRLPGNVIKVSASFDLDLSPFNVPVPEDRKMQFSRYLQVFADAAGTDQTPAASLASPVDLPSATTPSTPAAPPAKGKKEGKEKDKEKEKANGGKR